MIPLLLAFTMAPVPQGPGLVDGFYLISAKPPATRFKLTDGSVVGLGANVGKEFGRPAIRSVANDNTRFGLTLAHAAKLWDGAEPLELVLVVNQVGAKLSGHGVAHADGTRDLYFALAGLEAARKVAEALKCEPELRKDPGHRVTLGFKPEKASYLPGEAVTLRFELTNAGTQPVSLRMGGQQRGARDSQFRFLAQSSGKGIADIGDPRNFGGISSLKTLRPGESHAGTVDLGKWFQFDKVGTYRVTGVYELHLEDPERPGFDRGVWDDLACGDCTVTVAAAEAK